MKKVVTLAAIVIVSAVATYHLITPANEPIVLTFTGLRGAMAGREFTHECPSIRHLEACFQEAGPKVCGGLNFEVTRGARGDGRVSLSYRCFLTRQQSTQPI